MANLPVIVGFGGMNCAGRSSGFHSYKRLVSDVLSNAILENTWLDLAHRMNLDHTHLNADLIRQIKEGTLIRKIESFDVNHLVCHHKAMLDPSAHQSTIILHKTKLPNPLPPHWKIEELPNHEVKVTVQGDAFPILLIDTLQSLVSCAGNIPRGFDPGKLYNSHHHPRGLKLTVYGISDALNSLGIHWKDILSRVNPDEISVYAGSALGQIDEHSLAGLVGQPLSGNRINSKMMAMSLAEMPADFINSYIINSVGTTGTNMGACASFLYNLRQGIIDIQRQQAKVVIVGNAEAPVVPEVIEGFRVMGALATDEALCALDKTSLVNHRRACRPFSTNVGFTIAEGAQFIVLMNDALALELGASIYGSVADVFINADANKKSISKPGVGNYLTMSKAVALAKSILGQDQLNQTYVQAHGTGTPQNRTSESHLLNEIAKTFSISSWPVTAIKAYLGHSLSVAAGDQLISALGVWKYDFIPGIKTIDHIADDVHRSHLNILMDHYAIDATSAPMKAVFINSKGFGGNNASGLVLSPTQTMTMLHHKYGKKALQTYYSKNEHVQQQIDLNDHHACRGKENISYHFGEAVMDETSITLTTSELSLSEFQNRVDLSIKNPFKDYMPEPNLTVEPLRSERETELETEL